MPLENPYDKLRPYTRPVLAHNSKLRKDAYDGYGRLLLSAGTQLDDSINLDRLKQSDVVFRAAQQSFSGSEQPTHANDPQGQCITPNSEETIKEIIDDFNKTLMTADEVRNTVSLVVQSVFHNVSQGGKPDPQQVQEAIHPLVNALKQNRNCILSLVNLKDADEYTFGHSVNVSILASALGLQCGLTSDLEQLAMGAVMHDVGKAMIPPNVLNKPGALADAEMQEMRRHPLLGARILLDSGGFEVQIIETVLSHHESTDGRGYPYAKMGQEIGLHAKITSIADVYDALTTDRPYRKALPPKTALIVMSTQLKASFEPSLLNLFIKMIGYYPVGSIVTLNNGCEAQVVSIDSSKPEQPSIVLIKKNANGIPLSKPVLMDLRLLPSLFVIGAQGEPTSAETEAAISREYRPFAAVA